MILIKRTECSLTRVLTRIELLKVIELTRVNRITILPLAARLRLPEWAWGTCPSGPAGPSSLGRGAWNPAII